MLTFSTWKATIHISNRGGFFPNVFHCCSTSSAFYVLYIAFISSTMTTNWWMFAFRLGLISYKRSLTHIKCVTLIINHLCVFHSIGRRWIIVSVLYHPFSIHSNVVVARDILFIVQFHWYIHWSGLDFFTIKIRDEYHSQQHKKRGKVNNSNKGTASNTNQIGESLTRFFVISLDQLLCIILLLRLCVDL